MSIHDKKPSQSKQTTPAQVESLEGSGVPASSASNSSIASRAEAARSSRQQGAALPNRSGFEAQFGTSFSDVRVHEDSVAVDHGARAVAKGSNLHFAPGQLDTGSEQGRFLLGHELAHVVQQRGGDPAAPAQAKSAEPAKQTGERSLEAEADRVGANVAAGKSVAGQIAGRAQRGRPQKFGAREHMLMGDMGAGQTAGMSTTNVFGQPEEKVKLVKKQMVQLADDYSISFGQMTALGGDHFGGINQMREFAKKTSGANSRMEIEYAIQWKKLGPIDESKYDEEAKASQKKRYYALAGQNDRHFVNPGKGDMDRSTKDKAGDVKTFDFGWLGSWSEPQNAVAGYHMNHVQAVAEAAELGASGGAVERALAAEAFASHFLTDSFSGGHVRTPRTDAREYWNAKVPMFFHNLIGYMAQQIARELKKHHAGEGAAWADIPKTNYQVGIKYRALSEQEVWEKAKSKVNNALKSMARIDFGDLVGLALHDSDNVTGVAMVVEGTRVKLYGDGKAGWGDEQRLAIEAVRRGKNEILEAYKLGASMKPDAVANCLLDSEGLFAAEKMIPKANPIITQPGIDWKFPTTQALLAHGPFREALQIFADEKAGEVASVAASFDDTQKKALQDSVVTPLKSNPAQEVMNVIDWTPSTGGGRVGRFTDDNAMDYYNKAKSTPGGVKSLTVPQRIRLIKDIMQGLRNSESEEEGIWGIISAASKSDARTIIEKIGWERFASNLDGVEDTKFRKMFPRSEYGPKLGSGQPYYPMGY